jgi:hypothetical protein
MVLGFKISNGHSPANLANLSTRWKFTIFGEFKYSPKWPFSEMCRTRQTRQHLPTWFAQTRQTRRHSPTRFAWTRQTRQHLPTCFARTCQTCQILRMFWDTTNGTQMSKLI